MLGWNSKGKEAMIESQNHIYEHACAGFELERDACAMLDACLSKLDEHFEVVHEAILEPCGTRCGWSIGRHTVKNPRVDRLLIPKATDAMLKRWNLGVTAIEVKRSGESLTNAAQQMRDYIGARYFDKRLGFVYTVSCGFVFPFSSPQGAALGQMNQERVGVITPAMNGGSTCAKLGSDICIAWPSHGPVILNLCRMQFRSGHR
jgi:hypothetical protein